MSANALFKQDHYNLSYRPNPSPSYSLLPSNFNPPLLPEVPPAPSLGLLKGTAAAFFKSEEVAIPVALKNLGLVASAAHAGKNLSNNIQVALEQGQPPTEAYACQTAKILAEELTGKALKGLVVGGIPPYLTAAAASPPLALSVPVVLPMIPSAYQGAQTAAIIAGNAAEIACHQGFHAARQLTKKAQ
jgi:hypothetical protein